MIVIGSVASLTVAALFTAASCPRWSWRWC
jgi:hypothetical protein